MARKILLVLAIGYSVALFVGSVIPPPKAGPEVGDKTMHFAAYTGLAMLWSVFSRTPIWAALGCIAYGGLIELVQIAIPYRSGEWLDLAANAGGSIVGALLVLLVAKLKRGASTQEN